MFTSMRLRDKMTLWYTALTVITVAAFAGALYLMTGSVLQRMLEREADLSLQQLSAQVEIDDGMLTFENEVPLSNGNMYYIMEDNGSEIASYGKDIALFDQTPIDPGHMRTVTIGTDTWLILDSAPIKIIPGKPHGEEPGAEYAPSPDTGADSTEPPVDGVQYVRVRVAVSCALKQRVLSALLAVFGIGIPLIALVALSGGFLIAKRSLLPIRNIIQSAGKISGGNLGERIPDAPVRDELGDLTDTLNRMLANLEDAFEREKRFTADASHDLRTPVAVVRALTEGMLSEHEADEERSASLQTMLNECDHMQKIISQLLTITRGQEGRYRFVAEPVNLKAVCVGVGETLQDALEAKRINLQIDIPDALTFEADQSLLSQLFLNLMENAVKYGRQNGCVRIAATVAGKQVTIDVSDDGIGISEEALPHIFERFYREDAARDRTGTGLGLSIVQWIVNVHHGSIRVESKPGQGTKFTLLLPVKQTA